MEFNLYQITAIVVNTLIGLNIRKFKIEEFNIGMGRESEYINIVLTDKQHHNIWIYPDESINIVYGKNRNDYDLIYLDLISNENILVTEISKSIQERYLAQHKFISNISDRKANHSITSECVELSVKIKTILNDDFIHSNQKASAYWIIFNNEICISDDTKNDFWFLLLNLLINDYFDTLKYGIFFADNYTIDDLRGLLNSIINDILDNQVPAIDSCNYYYERVACYFLDKIFCNNKNNIDYLINLIINFLNDFSVKNYKIKKYNKWTRIIIDNNRNQVIKINNEHIRTAFKQILWIWHYDLFSINKIYNKTTLKLILKNTLTRWEIVI